MTGDLGIVEGYFGRPWSWREREGVMRFLAPHGYRFFLYAPKADAWLRRRWREPYPDSELASLAGFAAACRSAGVRCGAGLSPHEAYLDFDGGARAALAAKVAQLDAIGIDDLAILFDDMRGDLPDLAERQAEIIDFVAARTRATRILMCPTYYSDDPVLDRVFGQRPEAYLATLGAMLDPAIGIFWTGDTVCAREHSVAHLSAVGETLRRKPFLWDNYPVNDGPRMSPHLHLRGFEGRPRAIVDHIAGHAINPALQPVLSCIPALTLAAIRAGDRSDGDALFAEAAAIVGGPMLGAMLVEDVALLQDRGLGQLGEEAERLRRRYGAIDHPAASELLAWLDGGYAVSGEEVQTQ